MTSRETLGRVLHDALAAERSAPVPIAAVKARLGERLAITIGGLASPPAAPVDETVRPAGTASSEAASDAVSQATAHAGGGELAAFLAKPAVIAVAMLTIGFGAGLVAAPALRGGAATDGGTTAYKPSPAAGVMLPAALESPVVDAAVVHDGVGAAPQQDESGRRGSPSGSHEPRPTRRKNKTPVSTTSADSRRTTDWDLAAEQAIIEFARAALHRRDMVTAIAHLGNHASQFPNGRLGEERDALWIQALAASGDRDTAADRLARVRDAYPHSLFLPVAERAIEEPR